MFANEVVKVKAKEINPFNNLPKESLPSQLEISLEELESLDQIIGEENKNLGCEIESGYGFIVYGNEAHYLPNNIFRASTSSRSIFSKEWGGEAKWYQLPELNEDVLAVKGSGCRSWHLNHSPVFELTGAAKRVRRRYPIVISKNPSFNSHKFWGGESLNLAQIQYINALILQKLIRRHEIPDATISPISIRNFEELPVLENGELKILSLEDYCDSRFKIEEGEYIRSYRIPCILEAKDFSEFFYRGNSVNLRCPPESFSDFHHGRQYSAGSLAVPELSKKERWNRIKNFSIKVANLAKTVHCYGGTLTTVWVSSLTSGNVSITGTVCDLDTLDFSIKGGAQLKSHQENDIDRALHTIRNLANLYEDSTKKNSYAHDIRNYPKYGFAKDALEIFREVYEIPSSKIKKVMSNHRNI